MVLLPFLEDEDDNDVVEPSKFRDSLKKPQTNMFKTRKFKRELTGGIPDGEPSVPQGRTGLNYDENEDEEEDESVLSLGADTGLKRKNFQIKLKPKIIPKRNLSSLLDENEDIRTPTDDKTDIKSYLDNYTIKGENIATKNVSSAVEENAEGIVLGGSEVEDSDFDVIMPDANGFSSATLKTADDPFTKDVELLKRKEIEEALKDTTLEDDTPDISGEYKAPPEELTGLDQFPHLYANGLDNIRLSTTDDISNIGTRHIDLVFHPFAGSSNPDDFEAFVHKLHDKIASISVVTKQRESEKNHLQKELEKLIEQREEYSGSILRALSERHIHDSRFRSQ